MATAGFLFSRALRRSFVLSYKKTQYLATKQSKFTFAGNSGHQIVRVGLQKNSCLIRGLNTMVALSPMDPSSYSLPDQSLVKHISLKLKVDFDRKILEGVATLNVDIYGKTDELILDVRDLTIHSVKERDGNPLDFVVSDAVPDFGSKLTIPLPKREPGGDTEKMTFVIEYQTSPKASALQWLEPPQTSGKTHPFLFSQCQPIHARSIVPCQDTPAVKFTYDAAVTVPAPFVVLMSALRCACEKDTTTFDQRIPIPSYLLAIAVGVLEVKRLGPRLLVWAEKNEIERAAWEFAESPRYLAAATEQCGRYVWEEYDLLVLPPSFPYGGMENPCLTFVTPTLLAGDRSQADVIVHEIMHSWTGNLVTNRNFEHFWLNEGFTVFLERKVAASLISDKDDAKKSRDFQSLLGLQSLTETVNLLGESNPLTKLVVDLKGVHPDDAFSRIPYEKGSLFLRYLEDVLGGPDVFDGFLRSYIEKFQRKSVDTDDFKNYLHEYFSNNTAALKKVDWNTWLNKPGMPPVIPDYDNSMTKVVSDLVEKMHDEDMTEEKIKEGASTFTAHQTIHFLQELLEKPALERTRLEQLGNALNLSKNPNTEIYFRWLRLCIRSKDKDQIPNALNFVNSQGRMKYVRPIYRDLYAWEEAREEAIKNFLENEKYMMHVSAYTIRKDLHLKDGQVSQEA